MYYPTLPSLARFERKLLYVGNHLDLTSSLRKALQPEGWFVVRCPIGSTARIFLRSQIHYDVLMFDEELPDASGRELMRLVCRLKQRRRTPAIILLLKDCVVEARRANTQEFLWKPERLQELVEMVRRLLVSAGG